MITINMDRTLYNAATAVVYAFQVSTTTTTSFVRHNCQRGSDLCIRARHNPENDDDNITNHNNNNNNDSISNDILRHRMYPLQIATLEQIYQRSLPLSTTTARTTTTSDRNDNHQYVNNIHSHHPIPFIEFCLHCLLQNDIPYPDSGIRFLLRVSTKA
jgi:hypothetical protein